MNKTLKGIMSRGLGSEHSLASITAPIGVMQADLQKLAGEKSQRLLTIEDEIEALALAERTALRVQVNRACDTAGDARRFGGNV